MSEPIACVIGWPVSHSRSPTIHRFWLESLGIAGDYILQPVEPETIASFFASFADAGFVGCNVTVPHKEAAFAAVDVLEPAAEALGALNTIWLDDRKLVGTSTDGYGFLANLDQNAPGWDAEPGPAVILGAGGASRAVVWALLSRGFAPVHIVNRTVERAQALATAFGSDVRPAAWSDLQGLLPAAKILVNATSLGMVGQPDLNVDLDGLSTTVVVNDLVYVPLETGLLADARERGVRTVDGLGMLLHQAVPGFERWFGARPEVTPALRAAVVATLDE
ncbi:shikimate dehydrogenase [Bauldia sp.]|uniref:shikimate dehydrogenase n=1 Tax=Bauldia sp. TaxID=2575872 RepID=UPI003BADA411